MSQGFTSRNRPLSLLYPIRRCAQYMSQEPNGYVMEALEKHPCYSSDAHRKYARMHIPVAPKCNIQCNYCNRKFDCCNESRPGVTSEVLSPEQASEKVGYVKEKIPELSVVGIAGPGDPMANESTFESLRLIGERHPDLTLCVSTNGLALPENAQRLYDLGVRFVTVTMNACDPEIGAKVYSTIRYGGGSLTGIPAAELLISKQTEGIEKCSGLGMVVKVNIVMVPGINDSHIPDLVRYVKSHGAYLVNILPLIPVEGTPFASLKSPTPLERKRLMDECSVDARMMRHCRQCRADAIGLLGEDRSQEFVRISGCSGGCGSGCGPSQEPAAGLRKGALVAVASSDGESVDCGFGSAPSFYIYDISAEEPVLVRKADIDLSAQSSGEEHKAHIRSIVDSVKDCKHVVVLEIGPMPSKTLSNMGIEVVIESGNVSDALRSIARPL